GVVGAADHAAPAAYAPGALRARAAEEGIGHGLAGLAQEHADPRLAVGGTDAEVLAELVEQLVGGVVLVVGDDAEHPLGLGVVGAQLAFPVRQAGPLRVGEERHGRHVERVRVAQAAAAHAASAG